ncbi:MAG: Holliday junction branch migration DNA helicase RuvB [Firmicutes bacterium]|uniref:Holliday junction branch migration complex subunit RuvB n=1 Tax=Candidatus Gallilactobacillus intestinavium TaxID=2840838 RepID=A0A9D9E5V5_9LACO|nr:Holliday junction branch migration DNA helicase RuvB [Candidatus Gallilactobacillus intestinavium]
MDNEIEESLRPSCLNQYIGQDVIKKQLQVYISAALKRKESLDHVLLYGPPGLGKTTLAMIIANELHVNIKITSGPAIEKSGDLVALLNDLDPGDVLFIDEIHRLPKSIEEILYSAMEDFFVDIIIGQGSEAHSVHLPLPPFTLIGATTRVGLLSSPLRDRFGIIEHMNFYNSYDLDEIIKRSAKILQVQINSEGSKELALRSRGTPRIANRLLKRVRDFAEISEKKEIDEDIVKSSLHLLNIDNLGLDELDIKILKTIIYDYSGGPVGLSTLASSIGEEKDTISDVYEPYLMQIGMLKRTTRGRVATKKAYDHFNLSHE